MSITNAFTPPDACAALVATLAPVFASDPDVLVTEGVSLADDVEQRTRIFVADTLALTRTGLGRHRARHELYDLAIAVEVEYPDPATYQTTRARCWEILRLVDQAITNDETLGGVVSHAELLNVDRQATRPWQHGWFADAVGRVTVKALVA